MTQTEKEQYETTIKNMQSKIDWLRDQRKLMETYGKKHKPLTDEVIERAFYGRVDFVRAIEAAHGIK